MSKPENTILVGRIGAVYGVKGWLKVLSFTDNLENIFDYQPWLIGREGFWQETKIVEWRRHNKGLIVKLDGVDVREKAQQLTGMDIVVRSEQLPELPDDEFYWRDLVGLQVVNLAGYNMGTVTSLMETGSNDVLVVKANANDAFSIPERLIPFIDEQVIKSVDIKAQLITVDWDADF